MATAPASVIADHPVESAIEPGAHGEHAAVVIGLGAEGELGEDRCDVALDGLIVHDELTGSSAVGTSFGHERKDLTLPTFVTTTGRSLGRSGLAPV